MKKFLVAALVAALSFTGLAQPARADTFNILSAGACTGPILSPPNISTAVMTVTGTWSGAVTLQGVGLDGTTLTTIVSTGINGTFSGYAGPFTAVQACFTTGTSGSPRVWLSVNGAPGQLAAGGNTTTPLNTRIQDGSGGTLTAVLAAGANAVTNSTASIASAAFNYFFNGATWDRGLSQGNQNDAIATSTLGIQTSAGFGFGFNGTTWDRLRVDPDTTGTLRVADGGATAVLLNSGSAQACTNIQAVAGRVVKVINAAASAQTATISIFNDAGATCSATTLVYSAVLGASQVVTLDIPLTAGLAYTLSAAAVNNITITKN